MSKAVIVWQCPYCEDICLSNNWTTHTINYCDCGECGCDMENGYVRWIGTTAVETRAKYYDMEELLK